MKLNQITRLVLGTGIALALAAAITMPLSSQAADPLKGAQLQQGQRATVTQALPPLDLTTGSAACLACKNVVKAFATNAGRGAFVKTGVTVTHQCPLCKTAVVTTGAGKGKVTTAVHTCGNGQTPSCCSGMAGM